MRLPRIVVLTALVLLQPACEGLGCRNVGKEDFDVSMSFTESDLVSVAEHEGVARNKISCEDACNYAYNLERGWHIELIRSCASTIDLEVAASPDTPRGQVSCTGLGMEDYCD